MAGDALEQGLDVVRPETVERDAGHLDLALQLRERLCERVTAIEVGFAVGADHHQVGAGRHPSQRAHHAHGRVVGPVQVLDHECDRRGRAHPGEELTDGVVQTRGLGIGRDRERFAGIGHHFEDRRGEPRDDRGVGAQQAPDARRGGAASPVRDRFGERSVGNHVTVVTPTDQHRETVELRGRLRATIRVLPIPGSPATSTTPPTSSRADVTRPARSSRSLARPT